MDDPNYDRFSVKSNLAPGLGSLGYSRQTAPRKGFGAHQHDDSFELCLIRRGSVDWWTDEQTYMVSDRNVYISYPNEVHGSVGMVLQPCELYWFQLYWPRDCPPGFLTKDEGERLYKRLHELPARVFRVSDRVIDLFDQLIAIHRDPDDLSPVACRGILLMLLALIVDEGHGSALQVSRPVRDAMNWMHRHASDDYTLDDVAAAANLSVSRLQARFRAEAGCALGEYRTRLKLSLARRLLTTTDLPVIDIAMQLGFSSSQYFATIFRRHSGVTPRVYRQRYQAAEQMPAAPAALNR